MTTRAFFALLAIATLVASNPVPQQYASQQIPFRISDSLPGPTQVDTRQTNPYTQYAAVQNQASGDGTTMNELLISKILRNPCLQKILDPNTKLFGQNGREIQRQPNTAVTPNVVNNYFIVPPEFFNLNSNKTEEKATSVSKKRKNINKKANLTKTKTKLNVSKDVERNNKTKNNDQSERKDDHKKDKKKKKRRNPAKIAETEINIEQESKEPKRDVKITKKRKKQEPSGNTKSTIETSSPSDDSKVETHKQESVKLPVLKNNSIRRKKTRNESDDIRNKTDRIPIPEIFESHDHISPKIKKIKSASEPKKNEYGSEIEDGSHLKDIETPLENSETKSLKENSRPTKSAKENGKSSKTNTGKVKKGPKVTNKPAQSNTPLSQDMLKHFFPYMYMGSNFYSNGNYPFNFEQFYQPHVTVNDRKNNKSDKKLNEPNKKGSLPNVYEVKLKPKKPQNTTTVKTLNEETTNKVKLNSTNIITTATLIDEKNTDLAKSEPADIITTLVSDESATNIPVKDPTEENPSKTPKKEELEPNPIPEAVVTKANLEMPPTVIEDLHEYITPELGHEDIIPTIHTNGIINDYYPTFYDDAPYNKEESYYLRDLEDERHFYTTDRGLEEPLNRDRRKYEKHEEYPRLNLDIKDRINFRRTYKFRENEKANFADYDKSYLRRPTTEKIIEKDNVKPGFNSEKDMKQDISSEDIFQSPPILENPDFKTSKIDEESFRREPMYTDVELLTDHKLHSDPKPMQFSKLVNFDADVPNNDKLSTNKPRGDRIETVFAKTRVVKYGVAKEEENTSSLPLFENDGKELYGDGHTTYVLAKSLGHSDDYFW